MPQVQLPVFPAGVTHLNANLAFESRDGQVTYFNGVMPLFVHDEDDLNTFRMITSQFYVNGTVRQADICRAFGIPAITVKRAVKKYREQGAAGFYQPRKGRGASVLTPDVLREAQRLLDQNKPPSGVAKALGLLPNTLNKAILDGRLHKPGEKEAPCQERILSNKSQRNALDHQAPIGMGATNIPGRVAAMLG